MARPVNLPPFREECEGKNTVLKGLRWVLQGALLVIAVAAAAWTASRLMPVPAAQREALVLMQQPSSFAGENAFEAIWLLDFDDVPAAERQGLLEEDRRRIADLSRQPLTDEQMPLALRAAQGRYPSPPSLESPCRWSSDDCIARLRADPASAEAALLGQQALLARIAALSAYDHYQNPFVPDARAPMPNWTLLQRPLTAHALAHVQGRSDEALAGLCNDTRTAKMLMARSDALISAVLGASMVRGNVSLLAQVLAELQADHPLPASCDGVFSTPAPQALSLCTAMRGEFRMVSEGLPRMDQPLAWLAWDRDRNQARTASVMQGACTEAAAQMVAADRPLLIEQPAASSWRFECVANMVGCVLGDIAAPAYRPYAMRLQDAGASLRLAEGLLWLRANPHADAAQALAAMPAQLRDGERPLRLSTDGRQLQVALYAMAGGDAALRVPLPASRLRQ